MIRLTVCQLCLLNGTVNRSFSGSRIRWRKSISAASPTPVKQSLDGLPQEVEIPTPSSFKSPPAFPGISTNNLNLVENAKQLDKIQKIVKSPPSKSKTTIDTKSNVEINFDHPDVVLTEDKPLKLLNTVDPSLLDEAIKLELKDLPGYYLGLSKFRLTGLVVVTAMAGYALAPAPFFLGPFVSLSIGTALTSAAANTINQIIEVKHDAQMDRTKNRVLVRNRLSREHAAAFAVVSGIGGLSMLAFGANGLTAVLGGANLLLYTCLYTPLKRHSIVNTWVGSVVGGIPPLMGWAACTGELSHGALLLGGILFAWQFPHFNALSWNLKNDYGKAGYKMMAVSHPELCRKTSLRYSLSLILISGLAPVCDVTSWTFALDSLPLNGYLAFLAYKFYQNGDSASSRKLFRFSLIHLPALIMLMMVSKKAYKTDKPCSEVNKSISSQIENQSIIIDPVLTSLGDSIISNQSSSSSHASGHLV